MTNIDRWTALECAAVLVLAFAFQQSARAQDNATATSANTAAAAFEPQTANGNVPRLIRFSGVAQDETHNPTAGVVGITFSLYKDQQGGSPLWIETQNVQADANGRYTALLGSASAEGMPLELFSSGEAHWLGVQIQGQPERARVLLVSVPYALKAYEAETLSGRSISDFVLLNKTGSSSSNATETPVGSNGTSGSSSPLAGTDGPTNFTGVNATQIVSVTQKGAGLGLSATANTLAAVAGTITGKSNTALYGLASNTSKGSNAAGVTGQSNTETGPGVAGYANGINGTGVLGVANATTGGAGVSGISNATSGITSGVYGQSASTSGSGVSGNATATSGYTSGVYGQSASVNGTGVYGSSANWVGVGGQGATLGVWGDSATINGTGVAGYADATTGNTNGVYGQSASTSGIGVSGSATATTGDAYGIYGQTATTGFGAGVIGVTTATTGNAFGVFGQSSGTSGNGVFGIASAP
jgi:trimeric autotransporter adhesin